MRALKIAAIVGVGMTIAGVAFAGPWTDPAGRVNFTAPSGWVTQVQRANPQTIVLTGNANDECYVMATPNPNTASANADRVHRAVDPISPDAWVTAANAITPMFPNHSAHLTSQSVDTSGFWPIQRAQFTSAARPVIAALTSRPGLDLMAMCWTYGGADATATYESLFRSLSNSQDATWQASAAQQATDFAAQQAAAQAAAQQAAAQHAQQQQAQSHGRNGRDRADGPALNPGPH
ncbi:MAG: hypothetical protein WAU68_08130 [Vitreimonas sp.]